jgi:uncharacterized coiled-coil protein SlyX
MTDDAYERGKIQGVVDARLTEHGEHLEKINGSMSLVADRLKDIDLSLQRLTDRFDAAQATVIATANALEKAEQARRVKTETTWSPKAKFLTVLSTGAVAVSSVVGVILLIILHVLH